MVAEDEMTVRLTVRALKSDVPAINRLRSLLKTMLRAYEFRVESVEDVLPKAKRRKIDATVQETRTPF